MFVQRMDKETVTVLPNIGMPGFYKTAASLEKLDQICSLI
jgi:hypothetical protein